jgi:hypothetical protein
MYRAENLIHRKDAEDREPAQRKTSARTLRSLRLGSERASGSKAPGSIRGKLVEWVLIAIVVLYAAGLLLAPLLAIFWGALAEGFRAVAREMTSADAIRSLKLT